ncbi:MAG: hypothetical protein HYR63_03815 [Proteobacteria bacterium]|nr:hypothetical protein [Pseudomonadota bacterium]MBI3498586.1 hypothetical protein [Pseudomonadota bacterium]
MNEKPVAGLFTVIASVPLLLCCLGPVVLGSVIGGIVSLLGGLNPAAAVASALAIGVAVYAIIRWRKVWVRRCALNGRIEPTVG